MIDSQSNLDPSVNYAVGPIPYHTHNGTDSPVISETAGVTSAAAGTGIRVTPTTGDVVISNTGVIQLAAGTNVTLSGTTGTVTVSASSTIGTWKFGTGSKTITDASGNQTIAHGLGKVPAYVEMFATWTYGGPGMTASFGSYDGTTNTSTSWSLDVGGGGGNSNQSFIIYCIDAVGVLGQKATATVDATNITLAWTKVGTPNIGGIVFYWKVWG